mmetsp:Transcript_9597/g.20403  ORF Transcript_9597/g.20403 Transcript_9597/m.20403 type:complete len:208 (+) Transcript_9597:1390-2013(+)
MQKPRLSNLAPGKAGFKEGGWPFPLPLSLLLRLERSVGLEESELSPPPLPPPPLLLLPPFLLLPPRRCEEDREAMDSILVGGPLPLDLGRDAALLLSCMLLELLLLAAKLGRLPLPRLRPPLSPFMPPPGLPLPMPMRRRVSSSLELVPTVVFVLVVAPPEMTLPPLPLPLPLPPDLRFPARLRGEMSTMEEKGCFLLLPRLVLLVL